MIYYGYSYATATASASATARASGSATSTASASATATSTSQISQLDADNIAFNNANNIAKETALYEASFNANNEAYNNALEDLNNNLLPNQNKYSVALLFSESIYNNGVTDVINLINQEFPNSIINYEKYVVNGTIRQTEDALNDFVSKYPYGQRACVSALTSILNSCSVYIFNNNLNILSLSISSASLTTQKLYNTITYGYYLDKSVMSSFFIIKDYGIQNIVIFLEKTTTNSIYFQNYCDVIIKQNNLLDKLPLIKYDFIPTDTNPVNIPQNSCVYVLVDTSSVSNIYLNKIKNSFINNTTSYLFFSNINYEIKDIFGIIPAIISLNRPTNYTSTSTKVYNSFTNRNINYNPAYALYDILYSLTNLANNNIVISKDSYVNTNAFQDIPEAYSNSLVLNENINGFEYGAYDTVLIKNSLLNTDNLNELYNKYKSDGSVSRTSDSQSIFKSVGIVPFFSSKILYADASLIKIYQENTLKYVKFDSNSTIDDNGNNIVVSNIQYPSFITNYDSESGLFNYLEKVYIDSIFTNPEVNITMSKEAIIRYIK